MAMVVNLTLYERADQQDMMLYAFQLHSFFLLDVEKNNHQQLAPEYNRSLNFVKLPYVL